MLHSTERDSYLFVISIRNTSDLKLHNIMKIPSENCIALSAASRSDELLELNGSVQSDEILIPILPVHS